MQHNKIFYLSAILFFPFLGVVSTFSYSRETWMIGLISFLLLFIFLYTVKLMGNHPEKTEANEEANTLAAPISSPSEFIPNTENMKHYQKKSFRKETLSSMVKQFLKELPNRFKIDSSMFLISEGDEFREFLIQRGKLFIECDSNASLKEDEKITSRLRNQNFVLLEKGKKLYLLLFTPTCIYGALRLESLSGFSKREIQIYLTECSRFAFELESRIEYESIILDPITLVYTYSYFQTILGEKFHSDLPFALFLLDISRSDNHEELILFLLEFFEFPLFKVGDDRLAFFLHEEEMENIALRMQDAILELDRRKFYAEFILAFSLKTESMASPSDWWDDAIQRLHYARKKMPLTQNASLQQ